MGGAVGLAKSRTSFVKGHTLGFKPGQSGNPAGRPPLIDDIHALARQHAPEAIAGLVEFMRQRKDKGLAMSAMIALLDRGFGRPPQAVYAQIGGTSEPISFEIVWGPAKTNTPPEDAAPTIEGTANGDAEEVQAEPIVVWGDGTPVK
jgi:hypothetical protein